jgi:predicted  nucleic acid-binding Zn-ribbon protein
MNDQAPRVAAWVCGLLIAMVSTPGEAAAGETPAEPLHSRIDRLMESARVGPPAAPATDAEFLRRASLDLTGMPPSVEEVKEFLADPAADKRVRAVDHLLDSPLFARHWAITLDVMLMERRPSKNVSAQEWQDYLLGAARENRPLNQLMGELLRADGADPKLRPAARFYLDRESEPNLITRDVGRIFFGRDMQCAQCHNHPLVPDYQQSDYYGLLAFISPGYALTRKEGTKETTFHAEKAGTDLAFDSVFVKDDHHWTGPRVPGDTELPEPVFPPGEEYTMKPSDQVLPVPRYSRRAKLASLATGGENRAFNENLANRLWAMMMGRGLVHPVDLNHPGNPPSQPELMTLLGQELAALKFDARAFLRELAMTRAYQHAIDLAEETAPLPAQFAAGLAELKARSEPLEAAAQRAREDYLHAVKVWHKTESALIPLVAEQDKALLKHAELMKKRDDVQKAVGDAQAGIAAPRETAKALADVAGRAQDVVKKLPKEKDLADAARIFANRSAAAAAELTSLEKAAAEKAVALKKAVEELDAAAKSVEAVRARVLPVRESVRRKEQIVLDLRQKMAESRVAAEEHQKRLRLHEAYARFKSLQEQVEAASRAVVARRNELAFAEARSADLAPALRVRQDEVKAADLARIGAEKARSEAQAALDRHQKIVMSVDAALAATEAARGQLPGDATLSDAARKLKGKSDELRSGLPGLTARLDAAATALHKDDAALGSANRALKASIDEKSRRDAAIVAAKAALTAEESRGNSRKSELVEAAGELTELMGNRFALAQLKPLSPEQIGWSILKVTGVYDRYRRAEEAELDKSKPRDAKDPAQGRARAIEVERRIFEKLKGNVAPFVSVYAAGAGQPQNDFFATADQALFVANGGSINGWIAPGGGNVSERMVLEKDTRKAAEDLFLTILSRPPTSDESADVARVLAVPTDAKPAAVQGLVWGLLTSAEFRFNH